MSTVDLELQALLIGGEWTPASGGATFERVDPYTGAAVDQRGGGAGRGRARGL